MADNSKNSIELTVVVNGQPVSVSANKNAPLRTVVPEALRLSNNSGQPPENWELRDENGKLIDLGVKIEDLQLGTKQFLNLKAGVGGGA
jgi:hypothetical protein